ncbi:hypothetical protein CY652_00650 [Burkholderia sp. WAC0059]|nr:hypothetical protein CY652_00650 [Burkholderia sp. WAC0059]
MGVGIGSTPSIVGTGAAAFVSGRRRGRRAAESAQFTRFRHGRTRRDGTEPGAGGGLAGFSSPFHGDFVAIS